MKLRYALPLIVVAGLSLVLWRGLSLDPRLVDSPLIGKPAPAFSLPRLDGQGPLSERDLSAQVSLFNVWASWCVACRLEHDILVALSQMDGVVLFGLNYKDERQDALRWLQDHQNPYVASGHDLAGLVGIDYGVYGVPETFVVDRRGVIRAKHIGPLTWDYVNNELLPLLKRLEAEA